MPSWTMDNWQFVERETVTDPKGHRWTVALDFFRQRGEISRHRPSLCLRYIYLKHKNIDLSNKTFFINMLRSIQR